MHRAPISSILFAGFMSLVASCRSGDLEKRSTVTQDATATPRAGIDMMPLAMQYVGTTSNGYFQPWYRKVTQAMARRSIADARSYGVTFARISASLYGPIAHADDSDLGLWRDRPAEFWSLIDQMMDDLDAAGLAIVPTLNWNYLQFPALTKKETVRDLMTDPSSESYALIQRFIGEFVTRYKDRNTILYYELMNEMNLVVDLDNASRCRSAHPLMGTPGEFDWCDSDGNIRTDEMIAYLSRLADYVRSLDPTRPITSGFGNPRTNAEHLRARPEFGPTGPDWTLDTEAQLRKNIEDTHTNLDIISVHPYGDGSDLNRFGLGQMQFIDLLKSIADSAGKPLFLGEYGFNLDAGTAVQRDMYYETLNHEIVRLGIPYSAAWILESYTDSPYTPDTAFNLEPGYTDRALAAIESTACAFGSCPDRSGPDVTPPRVVLTWPLEAQSLDLASLFVYAVASDDRPPLPTVEFRIDDQAIGQVASPPYKIALDLSQIAAGVHAFTARATDAAGNVAEFTSFATGGSLPSARPSVSVLNSASYAEGAAPASIVTIFGSSLSATTLASGNDHPTSLGGTTVLVDAVPVPLFYVSPTQINFYLPPDAWLGRHTLLVRSQDRYVAESIFQVTATSPGVFTLDGTGGGYPIGQVVAGSAWRSLVGPDGMPSSITLGGEQYLVLYGTGWRGAQPGSISAELSGTTLEVTYAGPQGSFLGEDQINIRLPSAPLGAQVSDRDLVLEVNGAPAARLSLRVD
jgi:uncharacterized protein (TIGR03437 family)